MEAPDGCGYRYKANSMEEALAACIAQAKIDKGADYELDQIIDDKDGIYFFHLTRKNK